MDRHDKRTPPNKVHIKKKWGTAIAAGLKHFVKPKISIKLPDEEDQLKDISSCKVSTEGDYETEEEEVGQDTNFVLVSTIFSSKMKKIFNFMHCVLWNRLICKILKS